MKLLTVTTSLKKGWRLWNKQRNKIQNNSNYHIKTKLTLHCQTNDDFVAVDPLLIFQRICVLKKSDEELKKYMNYKLAPYLLALFEDGQIRKTNKSTLYELFPEVSITIYDVQDFYYIIDRGMLLQWCKLQQEEKMGAIYDHYLDT